MKSLDPYWPSHASEPTSDKTYDVAAELGVHPMQAYGHIRAFRTRYPQEAPTGRLRGGVSQVERLALWDGPPGKLAAAFINAKVVDVVDGVHVAHDHEHYAGAVLVERSKGRERTRRWREKKEEASPDREGDGVTVTSPVTSPSLSLTHSLTSSGSGSGSEGVQGEGTTPRESAAGGRWVRVHAGRQGGWQVGKPYTVDELLEQPEGDQLRKRFRAFDGKNGRPTIHEAIGTLWENFAGWTYPSPALAKLANYLARNHEVHRRAYEAENGAPPSAPDSAAAERAKTRTKAITARFDGPHPADDGGPPIDVGAALKHARAGPGGGLDGSGAAKAEG